MLKSSTTYCLITLFYGFIYIANAQQIYLESGFSSAFFEDYENNKGENTLDDTFSKPKKPFIEGGYRYNFLNERIHLNIGASYNSYQIKTAFNVRNEKIPTTYNLSYLTLKLGANFSVIKWNDLKFQLHTHLSHDWLTFGTNEYKNTIIDLYKDKSLDRTSLRFHGGAAIEYQFSYELSLYLKYNIANSLKEKNEESRNGESYTFLTKSISVGLLYNLNKW